MKKSMLVLLVVTALVLAFVLPNLLAAEAPRADFVIPEGIKVPGDDFMIPKPEGIEIKEKTLPFSHSTHSIYGCVQCHKTGDVTQGCTDAGCHDLLVPATPEERRDIRYFEKAYHDRCIGCHRDLRKAGNEIVPVACVGCHPRPDPQPAI